MIRILSSKPPLNDSALGIAPLLPGIHPGVNVEALNTEPAYARLLAREFNLLTPENAMKFSKVRAKQAGRPGHTMYSRQQELFLKPLRKGTRKTHHAQKMTDVANA